MQAGTDDDAPVRRITLTFDNGPVPAWTERVLDILSNKSIKASFFVIGRNLEDPSALTLVREAHAAGHWIGNHTLSHTIPLGERIDANYAAVEIGEAQKRIGDLARPEKLFRPHGNDGLTGPHLFSRSSLDYLLTYKYTTVVWSSVPGDWKDPVGWVERGLAQVSRQPWSVVALHDIADACVDRLAEFIDRLNDQGVIWRQDFPEFIKMTEKGKCKCPGDYISD